MKSDARTVKEYRRRRLTYSIIMEGHRVAIAVAASHIRITELSNFLKKSAWRQFRERRVVLRKFAKLIELLCRAR